MWGRRMFDDEATLMAAFKALLEKPLGLVA
jgi:hypothetical protein